MSEQPELSSPPGEPAWVTRIGRTRPDIVLMAPYLTYLALLATQELVPEAYMPWMIALRGVGSLYVFWLFRRYFPPLGRAHLGIAIAAGVIAAAGWVIGHHFFSSIEIGTRNLGGRLFLFPGRVDPDAPPPYTDLSALAWWSQVVMRITVASTAVPVVEELFWRAFLLRALISWDRFEEVPLGKFTLFSFLGTSLLSTLQHPDHWAVSIPCWFFYNALMYWKKSIMLLILTHGITNLVLYVYVIAYEDWIFW